MRVRRRRADVNESPSHPSRLASAPRSQRVGDLGYAEPSSAMFTPAALAPTRLRESRRRTRKAPSRANSSKISHILAKSTLRSSARTRRRRGRERASGAAWERARVDARLDSSPARARERRGGWHLVFRGTRTARSATRESSTRNAVRSHLATPSSLVQSDKKNFASAFREVARTDALVASQTGSTRKVDRAPALANARLRCTLELSDRGARVR